MHKRAALFSSLLVIAACGGPSGTSRKYETPTATAIVGELRNRQAHTESFLAESRMEYWVKDQRIKTTVYVMGQQGADLACDGTNFAFVDFNKNCELSGPCTKRAIAQLLRVSLEPDDFLMLAVGSTPIIAFDSAKVTWNSANAQEIVHLTTDDGSLRQEIILDGREQRWDVLSSTVWGADGEVDWELTNKEFSDQQREDGTEIRLPGKTRFEQPKEKADLSIRWDERTVNTQLSDDKFFMELPGLPSC